MMLKWPTIAARIYPADTDDNTVRLAEIDENLQRVDLTAVERSMHITERKRIYEEIHGPAKAIGGRAHHRPAGDSANDNLSFAADTADRTGQNVKTVQRDAKRGAEIGAAELSKVVGTLISNPGTSLASCGWPKRWSPLQNGWRGRAADASLPGGAAHGCRYYAEADRRFISAAAGPVNSATHSDGKRFRCPGLAEVAVRVQHREVCRELRCGAWQPSELDSFGIVAIEGDKGVQECQPSNNAGNTLQNTKSWERIRRFQPAGPRCF